MTKVLALATYGDFLATFELSNLSLWHQLGCEVHCASNFKQPEYNLKTSRLDDLGVIRHEIEFSRSPLDKRNISSYRQLVKLIREEHIDIIDCHNAVIGVYARLAAAQCNVRKVVYTPHSFFFYKGCPLKNALLFKPIERLMAHFTDVLVAINREDYAAAKSMKVRGHALYVPGVGVDVEAIRKLPVEREKYCKNLGLPNDAKIFVSVGELISRKNHETAIRAFAAADIENAYYVICGIGALKDDLQKLIDSLNMHDRIRLLGYRLDAKELMKACDVFLFPSIQEGLPVALMEAMAGGLPCIVSCIRGNVDLIEPDKGGSLFYPDDIATLTQLITKYAKDHNLCAKFGQYNSKRIEEFDIHNVQRIMTKEYAQLVKE